MEWVETTAKSVAEAQDLALDQLGVAADEAEFDVVEEPRSGLFGRVRGEARVRARVKPASVRPKQDRRGRGKNAKREGAATGNGKSDAKRNGKSDGAAGGNGGRSKKKSTEGAQASTSDGSDDSVDRTSSDAAATPTRSKQPRPKKETKNMENERPESDVTPQEVGDAAVAFMTELAAAFGADGVDVELDVDGTDLDVRVTGGELGLMVGPGGRTLTAIQDLARVASQRRLGDHETRLRIDVGGYREKRRTALEGFAATVAAQVIETGSAKALEPMSSSDRKTVHDAIVEIDGVTSHSEGDDPARRVVITPA